MLIRINKTPNCSSPINIANPITVYVSTESDPNVNNNIKIIKNNRPIKKAF